MVADPGRRNVSQMMFSRDLRDALARGEISVSVRRWSRPQVKVGGRYQSSGVVIEIDSLELLPFSAVTDEDVRDSGEKNRDFPPEARRSLGPHQRQHAGLPDRVPSRVNTGGLPRWDRGGMMWVDQRADWRTAERPVSDVATIPARWAVGVSESMGA